MSDEEPSFASMKFIPGGEGVELARLQERVRMMEATVGEFRGDLKEIKVAMQLILGHHLRTEKKWRSWRLIASISVAWWCLVGAGLMYVFVLRHA